MFDMQLEIETLTVDRNQFVMSIWPIFQVLLQIEGFREYSSAAPLLCQLELPSIN